jgi:hypothetical protein
MLKLEGCTAEQLCVGNNSARQMKRGSLLWSQMGHSGSGSLADVKVTAGQVHLLGLVKSRKLWRQGACLGSNMAEDSWLLCHWVSVCGSAESSWHAEALKHRPKAVDSNVGWNNNAWR